MSGLTPQIPFMASFWIKSGYDMKVEVSAERYQVGALFKALIKAILVAPLKSLESVDRGLLAIVKLALTPPTLSCCRSLALSMVSRLSISGRITERSNILVWLRMFCWCW